MPALLLFMTLNSFAEDAIKAAAPAKTRNKFDLFLNGKMPVGFYLYFQNWEQARNPGAGDLDAAVNRMADLGFNYIYAADFVDDEQWAGFLELCKKRGIAVIPQLGFAYFQKDGDVADLVAAAVAFIKKYKDDPAIVAFSVKEEPSLEDLPKLEEFYRGILKEVPDAPLQLIHNVRSVMRAQKAPFPMICGTDRYSFWFEFWTKGADIASPRFALEAYRSHLDECQQIAVNQGAEFQAVFSASTVEFIRDEGQVKSLFYPESASKEERDAFFKRIEGYAASADRGWNRQKGSGLFRMFKWYRPPENCVRALAWISILEGAQSVAVWAWAPLPKEMKNLAHHSGKENVHVPMNEYISSILGWDDQGTPQLDEYAGFARQVAPFGKLLRSINREFTPVIGQPENHELVRTGAPDAPIVHINDRDAYWRSFRVPGYKGRVVILVNAQVGTWCEGKSPTYISPGDRFRIDEKGNLNDYQPSRLPRDIRCDILVPGMKCYDLTNGGAAISGKSNSFVIPIEPGGGRIFFISPEGSREEIRLKEEFGV